MDAIFAIESEMPEMSETTKDNTDKYKSIIDGSIKVIDDKGELIEDNTIRGGEVQNIISQYLDELGINSVKATNYKDIASKMGISSENIFITTRNTIMIELISLDEFVRYIRSQDISKVFMASTDISEDYIYEIDYSTKQKLKKFGCNVDGIEFNVTNFIDEDNIQVADFCISTLDGVGIKYRADSSFLDKINSILRTCVRILEEQAEAKKIKTYNNAVNALPALLNYLINDAEYKLCTNKTKRNNYKVQGKFLLLPEFMSIREMIYNKPAINTEEYIRFKDFYVQYDALFDVAKDKI